MKAIPFSYKLTEKEVYNGLQLSGAYKSSGRRALIESVLLVGFIAFFVYMYCTRRDAFSLVMAIVSVVLLLALNLVPRIDMRRQAKDCAMDIKLRIYAKSVYLETADGSQSIPLDATTVVKAVGKQGEQQVLLSPKTGGLLIIPVRAIPKEVRGQVLAVLLQNESDQ